MSNYTKIVDYAAKDALNTGDQVKLVKGTELGAEYDAIAVAIATKANTASPAFTGVSSFAVGAVGAPSIYMTGYTTTGWYNIGANNWGFAVSGAKVLDIASTGLAVTGTLSATGDVTASGDVEWSGAVTQTSGSVVPVSTVANTIGGSSKRTTFTQNTDGSYVIDNDAAGNGSAPRFVVKVGTVEKVSVSPTGLAVTGATTSSGGFVGSSTTSVAVNGTGSSLMLGYIDSAITSTTDAFVSWMLDTHALNPVPVNGSLLVAARNTAGAEVVLVAENAVRARVSSTGLAVTGTVTATDNFVIAVGKKLYYSATAYVTPDDNVTGAVLAGTSAASIKVNGSNVAVATSAGLAVTGALSATGALTLSGTGQVLIATAASAADKYVTISNTNGTLECGVSAGGEGFIGTSTADNLKLQVNGSVVGTVSSTGLAVTGALSASGDVEWSGAVTQTSGSVVPVSAVANTIGGSSKRTTFTQNTDGSYVIDNDAAGNGSAPRFVVKVGTVEKASISPTGLAVTGAISATTNTNNLYEAVTLTNSSDTSAGMQILTKNGYGNLVSIDMQQVDNGSGADDGVMNIKIATNSTLSTVASISSTGLAVTGAISATTTIKTGGYTVATLPAGTVGMRAYVTDATAPTYNGALTGGGAVTVPVFYNGSAWVSA